MKEILWKISRVWNWIILSIAYRLVYFSWDVSGGNQDEIRDAGTRVFRLRYLMSRSNFA